MVQQSSTICACVQYQQGTFGACLQSSPLDMCKGLIMLASQPLATCKLPQTSYRPASSSTSFHHHKFVTMSSTSGKTPQMIMGNS
jgi:hypothetical protein